MSDRPLKPRLPARRWFRIALALAIGGNLLGAGGAMYLLDAGTTDVSVDQALQRFREGSSGPSSADPTPAPTSTGSAAASPGPAAGKAKASGPATKAKGPSAATTHGTLATGVYVYATDGYEETDALSGQRHDYPAQTTITVSKHDCGYRWRWQPLEERWEESDGCRTSSGYVLNRFAIYHEFFKRSVLEDFTMEPDAVVMPEHPVAGKSWRWKGQSNDSAIDTLTTVIGFETIAVGSKQVRTVHIRYETTMTGANEGTQIQDRWLSEDVGLLVRMVNAVDAKVEVPFGGRANYKERYRIDLTSTAPVG